MKIRSGVPIWRALRPAEPPIRSIRGDDRSEVVVMGGGVTGALAAYLFVQAGINTVLVDKREPAQGSTAASTGLLQYEVDTPLVELTAKVGAAAAVHAYRRGLRAIDELESLVDELGEPCGFARRNSLYFSSHWWHNRRLRQECSLRQQHGFDVRLLSKADLARQTSIPASLAIQSTGDAQIDPYRLTLALLRGAQAKGLRVHAHAKIESVEQINDEIRLVTDAGTMIARRAVCAAGRVRGGL